MALQNDQLIINREKLCKEWCDLQDRFGASELLEMLFYAVPSSLLQEIITSVKNDYLKDESIKYNL